MINVIWYKASRGNWDHGVLLSIFERNTEKFVQFNNVDARLAETAIVIVAGRPDVNELHERLSILKSGIVILTSEEDAFFDWRNAIPSHLDIWTQYYSPSTKKDIAERLLLGAPLRIRDYKINRHLPKKYKWSFVGQVQNPFRQECVDVLKTMDGGFLHVAGAFGGEVNGIEYQQYLDIMCQSEFVICPSGSMCVDSFRLYEAMECGAIPITDSRSPRDSENFNYWNEVHHENTIPQVANWEVLPSLIRNIEKYHVKPSNYWWDAYKSNLEKNLIYVADNY